MTKTWRLCPEFADKFTLSAKDVAALFVSVTDYWYENPQNVLYRKKALVYNAVLYWLETGKEPEDMPISIHYALNKLQSEWVGINSIFF